MALEDDDLLNAGFEDDDQPAPTKPAVKPAAGGGGGAGGKGGQRKEKGPSSASSATKFKNVLLRVNAQEDRLLNTELQRLEREKRRRFTHSTQVCQMSFPLQNKLVSPKS